MENDIVVISKTFHLWSIKLERLFRLWFDRVKFRLRRLQRLFIFSFLFCVAEVVLSAIFRWYFYVQRLVSIIDIPLVVIELYGANSGVFYDIWAPVKYSQPSRQLKAVFSWRKSVPLVVKVVFEVLLKLVVFILNEVAKLHNSITYY